MHYRLVMTCGACPEQYDAFLGEEKVGYLRFRHGVFRVDVPDCGGEQIYEVRVDDGAGVFSDDERGFYLQEAVNAIQTYRIGHGMLIPPAQVPYEVEQGYGGFTVVNE